MSLNLISGKDGILEKAKTTADTTKEEIAKEQVTLKIAEYQNAFYSAVYVDHSEGVNTKQGDWIAKNYGGKEIETQDYKFTITGLVAPYNVTIKQNNTLKAEIKGTLSEDGKLSWTSSGSTTGGNTPGAPNEPETPSIPEGLEVGKEVTYIPSGIYTEWTSEHSGHSSYNYSLASGSLYTDSSTQTNMTISNWKVFKIDESTGEVQLVPDGTKVTTPRVGLYYETGYNNAVKLLNESCSSLYGNSSKNITARSIKMEDIESVLNYEPETEYTNTTVNVKYGQKYSRAYTSDKKYPNIYAEEEKSVITPDPEGKTKTLGRSDAASNWILGSTPAGTSIQPYQTYYNLKYSDFSSKLTTEENGIKYSDLLLPNTSGTSYWVASRCVDLRSSYCIFYVRDVRSGDLNALYMFTSSGGGLGATYPLFPVVSLSSELIEGDATNGFSVK